MISLIGTNRKRRNIPTVATSPMNGIKRTKKKTHIAPAKFLTRLASLQALLTLSCNSMAVLAACGSIGTEQYLHVVILLLINSWQLGQGKVLTFNIMSSLFEVRSGAVQL